MTKQRKLVTHLIQVQDMHEIRLPRAEVWPIPWMRARTGRPWEGLRMLGLWPLFVGPFHNVAIQAARCLVIRTECALMEQLCIDVDSSKPHLAELELVDPATAKAGEKLYRIKPMGQDLNMKYAVFHVPDGYELPTEVQAKAPTTMQ